MSTIGKQEHALAMVEQRRTKSLADLQKSAQMRASSYPGTEAGLDGPWASFRLKNLRRGAQDFKYLYLLEKMDKRSEA